MKLLALQVCMLVTASYQSPVPSSGLTDSSGVARPVVQAGNAQPDRSTSPPQRIVSLIPAVTEMLFAVGAGPQVIAVSSFDRYPPGVEKLQHVGALLDPDVERILSLRPELVAVYASQADLRRQLERAGIPQFVYTHAGLADVTSTIRELGIRVGHGPEAVRLARAIDARIAALRREAAERPHPRTLIVIGRESGALRGIYASGGIGFIHDIVTAAGGENIFADIEREGVQATTELILARRPEVILELRGSALSAEAAQREAAVWDRLPGLPAVRSHRVFVLVDDRTVVPGPRVAEAVEIIARALAGARQGAGLRAQGAAHKAPRAQGTGGQCAGH